MQKSGPGSTKQSIVNHTSNQHQNDVDLLAIDCFMELGLAIPAMVEYSQRAWIDPKRQVPH